MYSSCLLNESINQSINHLLSIIKTWTEKRVDNGFFWSKQMMEKATIKWSATTYDVMTSSLIRFDSIPFDSIPFDTFIHRITVVAYLQAAGNLGGKNRWKEWVLSKEFYLFFLLKIQWPTLSLKWKEKEKKGKHIHKRTTNTNWHCTDGRCQNCCCYCCCSRPNENNVPDPRKEKGIPYTVV